MSTYDKPKLSDAFTVHFLFEGLANSLFRALDSRLVPRVHWLGFELAGQPPELGKPLVLTDDGEIDASQLEALRPLFQESLRSGKHREFKSAVQEALWRSANQDDQALSVSAPGALAGYYGCLVVQLPYTLMNALMDRSTTPLGVFVSHQDATLDAITDFYSDPRYKPSLIDSALQMYLRYFEFFARSTQPYPEAIAFSRDFEEILRAAGRHVMTRPCWVFKNIEHHKGFFDACDALSTLTYEQRPAQSRMVLTSSDDREVPYSFRLARPVPLANAKAVRKLLETAAADEQVVCDTRQVLGICQFRKPLRRNLYEVSFLQQGCWQLSFDSRPVMLVEFGRPRLPRENLSLEQFMRDAPRMLQGMDPLALSTIYTLINAVALNKRGTLLVLSQGAAAEAARLSTQTFPIVPIRLTEQALSQMARVDGAVLVDFHGVCHAFGVILDGAASAHGTPARGSRFNSAVRYVESSPYPCMAFILSDDGGIDLWPRLYPTQSRQKIARRLEILRDLTTWRQPLFSRLSKALSWLDENRFYLSASQCDEVNSLKAQLVPRFEDPDPLPEEPFTPDPNFNESWLTD